MSNINDKATVDLFVNGEQAESAMKRLSDHADELRKKLDAALASGDKKQANKLQRELDKTTKELNRVESAAKGTGIVMNDLSNKSLHGLKNALKHLQKQLSMTKPDTAAWHRYAEQIEQVQNRIKELNDELAGGETLWGKFKKWADDTWPAIDLLSRGYDSAITTMRMFVDAFAEMDQEMANVRKFTGMTAEQVRDLNESFKEIDTRSSREELNRLAQEAGRLGLSSKDDVLGFVRAADKINVALDDLGEGATLTLSKLTDMFGDKERYGVEQSLLKTGSVINELSQSSSAAAPYIAHFAERMSGVGIQAKLTVPQIMAMGAVLDSMGQKVEASSTAVSQVLVRMMQDPAKYAKVAGLEVENFANLLRTDANEALLLFLDTLNKAGGLDILAPMFKDMGENGSRAIATLTTLAKNIDVVRQRQEEANVAFAEGTSIDAEFAVQNNTVQASIEKAQKRFQELRVEIGEKLSPLMGHLMTSTSAFARALSILLDFIIKNKGVIILLATSIGSYYAAVTLATVAQKAWTAAMMFGKNVIVAVKYGIGLLQVGMIALTHGTKAAGTAFTFLNQTMKLNPIGLVVSLVATLAVGLSKLIGKTDEYTRKLKESIAIAFRYNAETEKDISELNKLFGALEGATEGTEEYDKARSALLSKYGAYLDGLVSEEGKIIDLETAYKRLAEAIRIANEERGIQEARKAVDDAYFERMGELQTQLAQSLEAYGASAREAARIAAKVSFAMSSNNPLDDETTARLNELSAATPTTNVNTGLINHLLAELAPSSQNNKLWQHLGIRQIAQPSQLINDMYSAKDARNAGLNELDVIERQQRPLGELQDNMLDLFISYAEKAVNENGGLVVRIADALAGTFEMVQVSADEASAQLEQLQGEKAYRNGSSASTGDGTTGAPIVPPVPTDPDDAENKDPYALEKAWRQRQEAEARIAYATGQATYSEHTERMAQIATDYFDMLRSRTDLSADERLKIEADYWEAVNKETIAGNQVLLDEENRSYQELTDLIRENHLARLNDDSLSAEQRQQLRETYTEAMEIAELAHLRRIRNMYEEGSAEWLAAQRNLQDKELAARERHLKRMEDLEKTYASMKDKYFGDNPQERQAKYDKDFAALQVVYQRELAAAGNNAEERLRIEEAFLQAQNALRRQYGLESEEDTRNAMERGVAKSVEWLQGDGGKALTGTLSTLTSGMSSIFSGLSTMIQAELEIQTASIEKKYDAEIKAAQGNSYKVAKLEKKKEQEIAKVKNEANKKLFAMQVIQAVAQTAQNALAAYGSAAQVPVVGYILAPIAAAMAVAAGAIQIAAIKKQQQASEAQGYSEGGFTKPGGVNEPAGIVHAGEWVASQKLLANPVARPLIEHLDYVQRTNTIGSLRPDDVSRSITANNSLLRIAESDSGAALMVAAALRMSNTVDNLTNRLNEPFVTVNTVTGDHGINKAQEEYNRLMSNKSPKSKR